MSGAAIRGASAMACFAIAVLWVPSAGGQAPSPHSVPQTVPGGEQPQAPLSPDVLARGQERYDIFCAPCHGFAGYGDGMIVAHGFPAPPSFHDVALRDLTRERIVTVIGEGSGRMLPMGERIAPADRWAIAAYVKALQLSQQATGAQP